MRVFDLLPYAALVDCDIFSVHGGISPKMPLIEMLNLKDTKREVPQRGMVADLAWSDPDDEIKLFKPNMRGAGCLFGRHALRRFCHNNKLKIVTRSHQLVQEGFKWYFGEEGDDTPGRLLNVWSAPNYAYMSNNVASFLKVRYPSRDPFELIMFIQATERIDPKSLEADVSKYFA
jgi:diadenosine tetraphosphatase ApaH/serine/threonine PP2A family protein phosphatase